MKYTDLNYMIEVYSACTKEQLLTECCNLRGKEKRAEKLIQDLRNQPQALDNYYKSLRAKYIKLILTHNKLKQYLDIISFAIPKSIFNALNDILNEKHEINL